MEEDILKIIEKYSHMAFSRNNECAKEITIHVFEFIEWYDSAIKFNTYNFLYKSLKEKAEKHYQYWLKNVKK